MVDLPTLASYSDKRVLFIITQAYTLPSGSVVDIPNNMGVDLSDYNKHVHEYDLPAEGDHISFEEYKIIQDLCNGLYEVKPSTKICPNCGNTKLVLIQTQNIKLCSCTDPNTGECTVIPWFKDKGQSEYY